MYKPLLIALALTGIALGAASPAQADDKDLKYSITGKPQLTVQTDDGDIDISTGSAAEIKVHVSTSGYKISDLRFNESQNGNNVSLVVKAPHGSWSFFGSHHSIKIQIQVPVESDLDIHSGDGNVTSAAVTGNIKIDTGDGHITISGRFDSLYLKTGDGSIQASATAGSKIANPWNLRSGDGSITLRVPENFAADLDAHTGDGHINLDFPVTVSGALSTSRVRGKMNGGGGTLEINSGDGSIHIQKL